MLHLGAGQRVLPAGAIDDPGRRLARRRPDRATLAFANAGEGERDAPAVQAGVRQWRVHA